METNTMNMNVKTLKDILKDLPDDMPVIIPVITEDDANDILAFRYVRTAGVLANEYEPLPALCLNSSANGLDISSQVKLMGEHCSTTCEKVLI